MKKLLVALLIALSLFGIGQNIFAMGKADKDLADEYFSIAQAYNDLKKYDKAIDFYKKAESSEKYKRAAQYNLAQVYAQKKDWNNCIKYIKPLHDEAPGNIKISSAYAYALASAGKTAEALVLYKKIYDSNPETPEYFLNYARLLIVANKYDDAKKLLDEGKEKYKDNEVSNTIKELKDKIEKILNPPSKELEETKKTKDKAKKS